MDTNERTLLLDTLRARFERHPQRHAGIDWKAAGARLGKNAAALSALHAMEASGGEPDVIGRDEATGAFVFCDCAPESPAGRRSLCYDGEALRKRKENKPAGSAMEMAAAMGVELLDEAAYRVLQRLGEFDLKTSSWVATPATSVRCSTGVPAETMVAEVPMQTTGFAHWVRMRRISMATSAPCRPR
jgi:hypothetical protein